MRSYQRKDGGAMQRKKYKKEISLFLSLFLSEKLTLYDTMLCPQSSAHDYQCFLAVLDCWVAVESLLGTTF